MKLFPVIIRRIIEQSAGFIASVVRPGVNLAYRFLYETEIIIKAGIGVSPTAIEVRESTQPVGVSTSLLGITGTAAHAAHTTGVSAKPVIRQHLTAATTAANLTQITYNLTHRSGSSAATEANGPCGRQDFDTPANAQGIHDGTLCVCAGNAVAARCGRLDLAYADFTNKTELTIASVKLFFYYSQNSLAAASSLGGYNFGGADTQLFSNAALTSVNFTASPQEFDITAAVAGNWTNLNNLRTYIIADIAALAVNDNINVDAVELEVIATLTDTL